MSVRRSWFSAIASAGLVFTLMLAAGSAQARSDVSWSVGIGVPGVVVGASNAGVGYYAPAPVYYTPPPVYRVPAPVYYAPPPVVYAPPVYYAPRPHWRGHHRGWEHRGHRRDRR